MSFLLSNSYQNKLVEKLPWSPAELNQVPRLTKHMVHRVYKAENKVIVCVYLQKKKKKKSMLLAAAKRSLLVESFFIWGYQERTQCTGYTCIHSLSPIIHREDFFALSDNHAPLQTAKGEKITEKLTFFSVFPLSFFLCNSNLSRATLLDEGCMHQCCQLRDGHVEQSFYCTSVFLPF